MARTFSVSDSVVIDLVVEPIIINVSGVTGSSPLSSRTPNPAR